MKTRTPLAAAFLIMASSATAQPVGSANPIVVTNLAAPPAAFGAPPDTEDDLVFKCGLTAAGCTTAQLNKRSQYMSQGCPQPISIACRDFFMLNGSATILQFMGNQSNPLTANDDFFKKCGTSPWRPCTKSEDDQLRAFLAAHQHEDEHQMIDPRKGYGVAGGMVGPPAPDASVEEAIVVTGTRPLPPPFDAKDFAKTLADARANNEKKVVAVGNRFAIVNEDGTVNVCGKGKCDLKPRKPENVPGFADALQLYASINSGNSSNSGYTSGNKGTGVSADGPTGPASRTPAPNAADTGAGDLGRQIAYTQSAANSFKTASASTSGLGGSVGNSSSSTDSTEAGPQKKAIPVSPRQVAEQIAQAGGASFQGVQKATKKFEAEALRAAQIFNAGAKDDSLRVNADQVGTKASANLGPK